jgi:hypothetical protein
MWRFLPLPIGFGSAAVHFPETPFSAKNTLSATMTLRPMRAFEIHLNGKRLCTAGVGDAGVLTAIVRSDLRPHQVSTRKHSSRADEQLGLDVGGFDSSTSEHVDWKTPRLRRGDEILIRIIDANVVDKPSNRERADPDLIINEKKEVCGTGGQGVWLEGS